MASFNNEPCIPYFNIVDCDIWYPKSTILLQALLLLLIFFYFIQFIVHSPLSRSSADTRSIQFWTPIIMTFMCQLLISVLPRRVEFTGHSTFINYVSDFAQQISFLIIPRQSISFLIAMKDRTAQILDRVCIGLQGISGICILCFLFWPICSPSIKQSDFAFGYYVTNLVTLISRLGFLYATSYVFVFCGRTRQFFSESFLRLMKILIFLVALFEFIDKSYYLMRIGSIKSPFEMWASFDYKSRRVIYINTVCTIEFMIELIPTALLAAAMTGLSYSVGKKEESSTSALFKKFDITGSHGEEFEPSLPPISKFFS